MLNDFGVDHRVEASILEGQSKGRAANQSFVIGFEPTQLALQDVHTDCSLEVKDDSAGAASYIEDRGGIADEIQDNLVPLSLPVSLQPDRTIVGTVVVCLLYT